MIIIDFLSFLLLVLFYMIFVRKNQANSLFAAVSLLLANFISSPIAKAILGYLEKSGWMRVSLTIVVIYIVLIILIWGILYTILSNISLSALDQHRRIASLISSALISISIIAPVCFASNLIFSVDQNSSYSCVACSKMFKFYIPEDKKVSNSYIPKNLREVYELPENLTITKADNASDGYLLNSINKERSDINLVPLIVNSKLTNFAQTYAKQMVKSLRFSHIDKNDSGPEERAKEAGLRYVYLGENLALSSNYASVHQALMNSSTHRENILSARYKKVGITSLLLSNGMLLVVEEFSD